MMARSLGRLSPRNTAPFPTHEHLTPNGGRHLLFRWRDDRDVTTSEGLLKGRGIDVRGRGGYVCFPPSELSDGRHYRMGDADQFLKFADAPDWLFDLILTKRQPKLEPKPGKHLGRPPTPQHIVNEIVALATSTDLSIRQIQGKISGRVSRSIVGEITKRARPTEHRVL
jgi:hypothetical protein